MLQLQISVPYLHWSTNFAISTLAITLVFKYLPKAFISWKDAAFGGVVTALLLSTGAAVFGWYLSTGSIASAFEAAGTVAILLVGIYFLAQFFIFGAVFTRVCSDHYGNGVRPRGAIV